MKPAKRGLSVFFRIMEERDATNRDIKFTKIDGIFTSNGKAEKAIRNYLEALDPEAWSPTLWVKKVFYRPVDFIALTKKRASKK